MRKILMYTNKYHSEKKIPKWTNDFDPILSIIYLTNSGYNTHLRISQCR